MKNGWMWNFGSWIFRLEQVTIQKILQLRQNDSWYCVGPFETKYENEEIILISFSRGMLGPF